MNRILVVLAVAAVVGCAPKKTVTAYMDNPAKYADAPIEVVAADRPTVETPREYRAVVYFDLNRADIRSDAQEAIAGASKAIKMASGAVVELTGGCCPLGDDGYNDILGARRAAAVREAIGSGVCRSVGERDLVTADPAEYWRNRRCEIVVRW